MLYIQSVVSIFSKINIMYSFITSNLYEKQLDNRYEVAIINDKITRIAMLKYIVISARDERKVQIFDMYLSAVAHVFQ